MAPHIPDVSLFVPFYSLDPSRQTKCIYPTAKPGNPRCRFDCQKSDNERAIQLRRAIIARADQTVDLDQLIDYALSTCCRSGSAQHQDRIQNICLVEKLAKRWQAEILKNVTESDSHYSLRPRRPNVSTTTIPTISSPRYQAPTLEFQPHKTAPGPDDTVASKICENLSYKDDKRDFKTGSLYIFSRASSPGFVKIGYTGGSVQYRLSMWSKCGYTPIPLYSIGNIPFAHRAESLTHFELTNEWRRERLCKVCLTSHQEWFEVSKERAMKVLGEWAEFMRIYQPYDEKGILIDEWRILVKALVKRGETITAQKLLAYTRLKVKLEEKETSRPETKVGDRQYVKTEPVPTKSQYIKQEPREDTRLVQNVRSSSTTPPLMDSTLSITPSSAKATTSKTASWVSYAATSSTTQPPKETIKSEELRAGKRLKGLEKRLMRLLGKKKKQN